MIKFAPKHFTLPTWGNVASLGVYELLTHTPSEGCKDEVQLFENQKAQFIKYLDSQLEKVPTSCFNTSFGNSDKDFFWGCLSEGFANEGIAMMFGYKCTLQTDTEVITYILDYLIRRQGLTLTEAAGLSSPQEAGSASA